MIVGEGTNEIQRNVIARHVPGSRPERFDKAVASGADAVILDLEDAVAPQDKDEARVNVAKWMASGGRAVVRVNGLGTRWFEQDLRLAASASAVLLPKAEDEDEVGVVSGGGTPVIALLETPKGVLNAERICAHPAVVRAAFGNLDFAAHVGVDPGSIAALAHARSHIVYASSAAECAGPIDGVTTAIHDTDVLRSDASHARDLGFRAKLLIHPAQIGPVDDVFRPSEAELEWARSVLEGLSDGVGVVDGHMTDQPVIRRAQALLGQASVPPAPDDVVGRT
jgi:citrate lyase subunit beta / citryl-CoA lyase